MREFCRIVKGITALLGLLGIGIHAYSQQYLLPESPVPMPEVSLPTEADTPVTQESAAPSVLEATIEGLPCHIPDSPLIAQYLACYEGPFLEDGTDTETVCAALMLTNASDSVIEYACVILYQDSQALIFEATYLPPRANALILEKAQTAYSPSPVQSSKCQRLSVLQDPLFDDRVYVSPHDDCSMIATNLTDSPLVCIRIFYKHYYPEHALYLGGITYSAVLTDLLPGESRQITPYHYLTDQGRIIAVTESG